MSGDFLNKVWAHREERIYPDLFGDLGPGIFVLDANTFQNGFNQSPDPRWLHTGVFECPPSLKHKDWLYLTSGLSNPWPHTAPAGSPDEYSWLGAEFMFQVTQPGPWAINLVQRIAAFEILLAHNRYENRARLG